jgi:hypothetical protein
VSVIVDIKINTNLVASYSITRVAGVAEAGSINTYSVGRHFPDTRPGQNDQLVTLEHDYADPVEDLVARALPLAVAGYGPVPRRLTDYLSSH